MLTYTGRPAEVVVQHTTLLIVNTVRGGAVRSWQYMCRTETLSRYIGRDIPAHFWISLLYRFVDAFEVELPVFAAVHDCRNLSSRFSQATNRLGRPAGCRRHHVAYISSMRYKMNRALV
jgi:hypothetical protein